jgi:hypothetical protein
MPRKPIKKRKMKKQLSPSALAYLSDGEGPKEDMGSLWCFRNGMPGFFDNEIEPKELWKENRDDFLPEFILKHPGQRPLPWWQWDAPRQPDQGSGCWYEGTLPEPRRRIGGKGELHKGYVPSYELGIPQHWDPKTLDPDCPLIFESQGAYLLRNDLLSPQEKKYLASHSEMMEPEKVE